MEGSEQNIKPSPHNFSTLIWDLLKQLGVEHVFLVSGGAIANLWYTLEISSLRVIHCRHESGASFAATEAYFASNKPTVVLVTTGPGIVNALNGLFAARIEGAKVIFISGHMSATKRGRQCSQEPIEYLSDIYSNGALFNYATVVEHPSQIGVIAQRLSEGLASPQGFVAHLSIPSNIQASIAKIKPFQLPTLKINTEISDDVIDECAKSLNEKPFVIWAGFGARHAAKELLQLAEMSGAHVMCTPRTKGLFPEHHRQYIGITGFSGDESLLSYLKEHKPAHTLVLGTKMSETSALWNALLEPSESFIQVDIDPFIAGINYPSIKTMAIQAYCKPFLEKLLKKIVKKEFTFPALPKIEYHSTQGTGQGINPIELFGVIQKRIVENTDALILAEPGNSFSWAISLLRFDQPNRFRTSLGWGSMGHFVTGVIGAALVAKNKAIAIVGDGAMLMNNEINTAVKYRIPALWIVLNDANYNMCDQGMHMEGKEADTKIPPTRFDLFAESMGARAVRVEKLADVEAALEEGLASTEPFIIDVIIDASVIAPIGGRVKSLVESTLNKEINE